MDAFCQDIIQEIISWLDDTDKVSFLSITKNFHQLKGLVKFTEEIEYVDIQHLWYRQQFTNIVVEDLTEKISNNVTHLRFDDDFNQSIENAIPNSVIDLRFGRKFNQEIIGHIPNGITYLCFSHEFNKSIENAIPHSVTYLHIGHGFDRKLLVHLPSSVTHLSVCCSPPDIIPEHIGTLKIGFQTYHFKNGQWV